MEVITTPLGIIEIRKGSSLSKTATEDLKKLHPYHSVIMERASGKRYAVFRTEDGKPVAEYAIQVLAKKYMMPSCEYCSCSEGSASCEDCSD